MTDQERMAKITQRLKSLRYGLGAIEDIRYMHTRIKALEAERDQLRELLGEMVKCLGPIHMRVGTWFGGIEGANWRGDLLVRAKAALNPPAEEPEREE